MVQITAKAWLPPRPTPARTAVIRELLAWPEGENFSIFSTPDEQRAQRWYHRYTLPLMRKALIWASQSGRDNMAHLLMIDVDYRYWSYIGPFPDADLELALRQCHEDGIKERATRLRGRDARVAALLGQEPPKLKLDA